MEARLVHFSAEDVNRLRESFKRLPEVAVFRDHAKLAAQVASYGIFREVGTVNDELARFIYDSTTARPIRRDSLVAEMIEWRGLFGVRISSRDSRRLELRAKGFYDLVHPRLSFNDDGSAHSLHIFPEIVESMARLEGVDLVLVKPWALNSIFGGFDPKKGYYQTNFWELENNDALRFADLTRQRRLAFLGTHDLIAHIAGLERAAWSRLQKNAGNVHAALSENFQIAAKTSFPALVLPYAIGVVLDDLAQPPSYDSRSHLAVLNELLAQLSRREITVDRPAVLLRFPESFRKLIELSRAPGAESEPDAVRSAVASMIDEISRASLVPA